MLIIVLIIVSVFFGSMCKAINSMLLCKHTVAMCWLIIAMFAFTVMTVLGAVQYYLLFVR